MQPERDYEVGYKRPPKHTQFQKGQSGNPNGRPRQKKSLASALGGALHEKVTITENGRRRKIGKGDAICKSVVNAAAQGDLKAAGMVLRMMEAIARQKKPMAALERSRNAEPPVGGVVILPHNNRDPIPPELLQAQLRIRQEYQAGTLPEQRPRKPANENRRWDAA